MLNPNEVDELNDYAYGRCSSAVKESIEQQLKEDSSFRSEAELLFQLFDGFKALELEQLEGQINTWETKHQANNSTSKTPVVALGIRRSKQWRQWGIAAAAILLLALPVAIHQYWNSKTDHHYLYAQYFQTEPIIDDTSRGQPAQLGAINIAPSRNHKTTPLFEIYHEASNAYNQEDYQNAIVLYSTFLKTSPERYQAEAFFYRGIAAMSINDYLLAQSSLENAINIGTKRIKQQAEWYLVLTLLKQKQINLVHQQLEKIIVRKKPHFYQAKAIELQMQLKEVVVR